MTIRDALLAGTDKIGRHESIILLSQATGYSQTTLLVHDERVMTDAMFTAFNEALKKRCASVPLQYIIGQWPFMGLELKVDARALIPRPDTEVLVEAALTYLARLKEKKPLQALDVCTGSGCIGIALAYYADVSVTALDISPAALSLAQENAAFVGVSSKVRFIESDLYQQLTAGGTYDIIVSNPPYIPTNDIDGLSIEVRDFEPYSALDGGVDGLDFYRKIIPESLRYLCPHGALFLEVGPCDGVATLMRQSDYTNINIIKDYAGLNRVVYGNSNYL